MVDCRAQHTEEVMAKTSMAGPKAWPGDSAVESAAEEKCRQVFAAYIGIGFDDSRLEMGSVTTDKEGWNAGDRTLVCLVMEPGDQSSTRALRGSHE